MPSWLDLLMGGQPPAMAPPPDQQPSSPAFVPQQMVQAPVFAQPPAPLQAPTEAFLQSLYNAGRGMAGGATEAVQPFISAALYPGQVAQAGYAGNAPSPGEMVPGAMNMGLNLVGAGSMLAPEGALGMAGGRMRGGARPPTPQEIADIAARAEAGPRPIAPIATPEGLAIRGPAFDKAAAQAKAEVEAAGKGAGPMDLSGRLTIEGVPQTPLERYNPPRGVSARLQDALLNQDVVNGVSEGIQRGIDMGAHRWYQTEPIRKAFEEAYRGSNSDPGGAKAFAQFMDMVAATSPRSDVPTNIRNASYYFGLQQRGEDVPEEGVPYPYGHIAQKLHKQNFADLSAAVNPGWDLLKNPKPPSFSQNLQGNFEPVTADTHAFRAIGMRTGDPRFLEPSISALVKEGGEQDPTKQTLINKYGEISTNKDGEKIVTFRPRKLVEEGRLTMDEAKNIPMFWASKPNENEYAAVEQFYRMLAQHHGLDPAAAQAAGWAGSGELTGLGTVPDKTFAEMMNERALYTAKLRGEDPQQTLFDALRGIKPLLSTIPIAAAPVFAKRQQDQQQ
jgi:hypothetical protein